MDIISGILVIDCGKDPWELTTEELEYIPKPLLIRYWSQYIPLLWEKLPEHIRKDAEIASYRLCRKHWTTTGEETPDKTAVSTPTQRECPECQKELYQISLTEYNFTEPLNLVTRSTQTKSVN